MTFPDYVVFVVSSFRCKDVVMFCLSMFSLAPVLITQFEELSYIRFIMTNTMTNTKMVS